MKDFLGLSTTTWILIGILAVIASAVLGVLGLQLHHAEQEAAARQASAQQMQARQEAAKRLDQQEKDAIAHGQFNLLRN
jgi:Tfp pilus assembly protein PilV